MSCYDNIYSLCSSNNNPFSYRLAGLNNNTIIVTEKSTGREFQLSEMSTQSIDPCDYTTEYQSVDHATCYQLYLGYVASGSQPPRPTISAQINDTISILNDAFNNISNNTIALSGNNNTALILSSSEENLIHLGNISILTSLMYEQNQSGSIPPIVDSSGNIHQLNYQSLINMFEQYTNTTINSYYTQQNIQQLLNQTNLDSVANCDICNQRTPRSFSTPTTIVPDFVVETLQQLDTDGPLPPAEPPAVLNCCIFVPHCFEPVQLGYLNGCTSSTQNTESGPCFVEAIGVSCSSSECLYKWDGSYWIFLGCAIKTPDSGFQEYVLLADHLGNSATCGCTADNCPDPGTLSPGTVYNELKYIGNCS